jgi:5-enolpyruvylshikimate-3-phosphate synthase
MALSVLMTKYGGTLAGAEAVKKSMPDFYERLASLGANVIYEDK